jgi:LemA protein
MRGKRTHPASDANSEFLIALSMSATLMFLVVGVGMILFLILLWLYGAYNRMVDLEEETKNQWQNLEAQIDIKDQKIALVEQHDLVQVGLESSIYEMIVDARKMFATAKSAGDRSAMGRASGMMDSLMPQALGFAEDNPELTSHHVLVEGLQQGVQAVSKMGSEVEEYNQSAKNYNTFIRMFPAVLVAKMMGFHPADYFDELTREQVSQMFSRRADLGSFVESKRSEADIKTEQLEDEIQAIEAETELLEAKARLAALKESLEE